MVQLSQKWLIVHTNLSLHLEFKKFLRKSQVVGARVKVIPWYLVALKGFKPSISQPFWRERRSPASIKNG